MTDRSRNQARDMLIRCKTLAAAEELLTRTVRPCPSKAMCWGLFDGWKGAGRPPTLAGLPLAGCLPHTPESDAAAMLAAKDYREGVEIGRELSMREMAG